jgi:hypothetical protein
LNGANPARLSADPLVGVGVDQLFEQGEPLGLGFDRDI